MPVAVDEIISLLSTLADDEQMRVTVTQCVKSGAMIGVISTVGGLVGGPIGFAAAAAGGGIWAAATAKNFSSVVKILAEMKPEKKEQLSENVRQIMGRLDVTDVVVFAGMVAGNAALRQEVLNALTNFLREKM